MAFDVDFGGKVVYKYPFYSPRNFDIKSKFPNRFPPTHFKAKQSAVKFIHLELEESEYTSRENAKVNMSSPVVKPASRPSASVKIQDPSITASLTVYVGDLNPEITREEILKIFSQVGQVSNVSIRKNKRSRFAYAYVTYFTSEQATTALREFNQFHIDGKPCRVMKAAFGKSPKGPREANIFVKNLPLSLSALAFHDTFSVFGDVLSSKIAFDANKSSKGYGFVQFATAEQARFAISETNGSTLDVEASTKPLFVTLFVQRDIRPARRRGFQNVFFKNLPSDITPESFAAQWGKFGKITSAFLTRYGDGKPTGTGFVNFEKPEVAAAVIKSTQSNGPNEVKAMRALNKTERRAHQARLFGKAVQAPSGGGFVSTL
ncbi:hypothetical protein O181_113956 [Austropuccinia psidii MF-1]|uniref:RRM domain-containing protein n=1 Tax=Austropuccinia psidii MF-1 TaxID=1389203 RepID=A0A9Q3K5Z1_9BASI|nr:hypothetical protein [Austropuccinia psidii MF-1]